MSPSRAPLALLVASWIAAPGCPSGGGEPCMVDGDCARGEECTRPGDCVAEGTALRVIVRWTVLGEAPTPAAPGPCDDIAELAVVFEGGFEPERYRPVPCELGQAVYDKMPPHFKWVHVIAYDDAGDLLDRRSQLLEPTGESDVTVDLAP